MTRPPSQVSGERALHPLLPRLCESQELSPTVADALVELCSLLRLVSDTEYHLTPHFRVYLSQDATVALVTWDASTNALFLLVTRPYRAL